MPNAKDLLRLVKAQSQKSLRDLDKQVKRLPFNGALDAAANDNIREYTDIPKNMTKYLTTTEAAKRLDIAERTLRQWIHDGYIQAQKLNPQSKSVYQIPVSEVERILRERETAR